MAAFLQSKFHKTQAAGGEANCEAAMCKLPIKKKSWVSVIFVSTVSLHSLVCKRMKTVRCVYFFW